MTIIPRGRALGLTMQLPTEDKYTYKKQYVETQIAILMGGRVAEEMTQDDITTGAGNDIERATDDGPPDGLRVGHVGPRPARLWRQGRAGLPRPRVRAARRLQRRDRAIRIDREVTAHRPARLRAARTAILTDDQRAVLDRVATDLLERESLDGEEVYNIITELTGERLDPMPRTRPDAAPAPPAAGDKPADPASGRPTTGPPLTPEATPA